MEEEVGVMFILRQEIGKVCKKTMKKGWKTRFLSQKTIFLPIK